MPTSTLPGLIELTPDQLAVLRAIEEICVVDCTAPDSYWNEQEIAHISAVNSCHWWLRGMERIGLVESSGEQWRLTPLGIAHVEHHDKYPPDHPGFDRTAAALGVKLIDDATPAAPHSEPDQCPTCGTVLGVRKKVPVPVSSTGTSFVMADFANGLLANAYPPTEAEIAADAALGPEPFDQR